MLRACIHTSNLTSQGGKKRWMYVQNQYTKPLYAGATSEGGNYSQMIIGVPAEQGFWWPPSWVPSTSSVAFALASILQKARVTGLTRSAVGFGAPNPV